MKTCSRSSRMVVWKAFLMSRTKRMLPLEAETAI